MENCPSLLRPNSYSGSGGHSEPVVVFQHWFRTLTAQVAMKTSIFRMPIKMSEASDLRFQASRGANLEFRLWVDVAGSHVYPATEFAPRGH